MSRYLKEWKELIKQEQSGGCSRQKAKALKRIVRQGSGQGASVAGVQLKSEVSFIAIHNILGMVRIPVSTDCSKQPLQGFEWSLYTV